MDSDRTLTQKIVLWALFAMAVIFTVVNIVLKFFPGVEFEDTLLKVTQNGGQTVYTGEKYKYPITITVTPEDAGSRVELSIGCAVDHTYRVEYPGGTIKGEFGYTYDRLTVTCNDRVIFDGGYNPNANELVTYCDINGGIDVLGYGGFSSSDSSDPWYNYELSYFQVMNFVNGPETTTRGSWTYFVAALIVSAIGAVCTAFPRTLFYIQHALSVQNPEPTDFYLKMQEVSGVVIVILVFIVYMIGVTKIV